MTAVTKHEPKGQEVAASEAGAILSMIERAARDPAVDIEKMERLFAMQERMLLRNAEAAFNEALASMQPELPEVEQHGQNTHTKTRYAKWEDIHEAIAPVLAKHGFALTFRTAEANSKVTVTAILRHGAGHKDETSLSLPTDTGAGRNAVQAVGSSLSYGKRYTACALLNIRTRGEDDDGKTATKRSGAKVAGGGHSATQIGKEVREDVERGDEPGLQITDHSKDPLWDKLQGELVTTCSTRTEATDWWKKQKDAKQRKPHLAKAFYQEVFLPCWDDLPEVRD